MGSGFKGDFANMTWSGYPTAASAHPINKTLGGNGAIPKPSGDYAVQGDGTCGAAVHTDKWRKFVRKEIDDKKKATPGMTEIQAKAWFCALPEYKGMGYVDLKEEPVRPTRTFEEIVDDIWANRDRDYNVGCLVKRLQRIDKSMSGEARDLFAKYVPSGDLAAFARKLPAALRQDFVDAMKLLRDAGFQELLVSYPRPPRTFLRAYEQADSVRCQAATAADVGPPDVSWRRRGL